jgi:hypothetical protein
MTRGFDSSDLVQLPRLDSASAQTLGTQVLATAKGKTLTASITEALDDLASSHHALQTAATQRLPTLEGADPTRAKNADQALDASWSALFDFLTGWSKLPDHANAEVASKLLAQLFPEGLRFAQLAYKLEWAESNTRLLIIKERKLEAELETLGAAPIIKRLREAHKEYGDALGVTTAAKASVAAATLRDALDEFSDSLRHYIVRVAASVRKRDPKSAALAQLLLAPVQSWQTPGGTRALDAPPAPAPTPPAPAE